MRRSMAAALLSGVALTFTAGMAVAAPIDVNTSLYTPQTLLGTTTAITLDGLVPGSQAPIVNPDYTITFDSVPTDQGLVAGTATDRHAAPVAGVSNGTPEYLAPGPGLPLTTDLAA